MQRWERSTLVGVFTDRSDAEDCVDDLKSAGFRDDQIGFMMQDASGTGPVSGGDVATLERRDLDDVSAGEGALTGAVTGGLVGAAAAMFIPAIGPVLAGGILASALAGVAIGAATGGLAAALIDMGVSEDDARYYEDEFRSGRILVTCRPEGRFDEAWAIMERHGAYFDQGTTGFRRTA